MAIIREEKQTNYTVVQNDILNNPNMSLKAKGLLCFMLSKPNGWDFSINGLKAQLKEGRDSISSSLKELEEFKYLKRVNVRGENNRFSHTDYYIYDKPNTNKPKTENPNTVNHEQVSTILSKDYNKVSTIEREEKKKTKRFLPPSIKEVEDYCFEKKGVVINIECEKFINFYESKNWMVGKSKMAKWKSAFSSWLIRADEYNKNNPKKEEFKTKDEKLADIWAQMPSQLGK